MHGVKRIFYEGDFSEIVELPEETSRRLVQVLRAQNGDAVELLSKTSLANGVIYASGKKRVLVHITSIRDIKVPDYRFTAYQCIAKREYMDTMVEKYSELGVTEIVPVISSRSINNLKESALERYRLIARETALQSENEFITDIKQAVNIVSLKAIHETNILFHERCGKQSFPNIIHKNIGIVIGPEGGFTEKETDLLTEKGFIPYTPLNCILKAETAAVLFAGMVRLQLK